MAERVRALIPCPELPTDSGGWSVAIDEAIEDAIYAPYLDRQAREIAQVRASASARVPARFSFRSVYGLSSEMIERLEAARPANLEEVARIAGITPAATSAVLVALRKAA